MLFLIVFSFRDVSRQLFFSQLESMIQVEERFSTWNSTWKIWRHLQKSTTWYYQDLFRSISRSHKIFDNSLWCYCWITFFWCNRHSSKISSCIQVEIQVEIELKFKSNVEVNFSWNYETILNELSLLKTTDHLVFQLGFNLNCVFQVDFSSWFFKLKLISFRCWLFPTWKRIMIGYAKN